MRSTLFLLLLCASGLAQAQAYGFRDDHGYCSRDPIDLMFELSAAVESEDVNRLAALYDWNGIGSSASRAVMDRLESLTALMLVDVVPVYPAASDSSGPLLPPWPVALVDQPPTALRLVQARVPGDVPATSTTFHVRRRMGCWWVAF